MTVAPASPVLDHSLYIPDLKSKKRDSALAGMVAAAHRVGSVRDPSLLIELLRLRERLGTTALGKGVAIPHARSLVVVRPQLVVARALRAIEWDAPDDQPVQLVLLTLSPAECSAEVHHAALARAAGVARLQRNRQKLIAAASSAALAHAWREVSG
jgi:PTS system nitrogen regulatory IIA component